MVNTTLLAEDDALEAFAGRVALRVAGEMGIDVRIQVRGSNIGGYIGVLRNLEGLRRDLTEGRVPLPDVILAAVDANCRGYTARRDELLAAAGVFADRLVFAIADPHVERWFLLDGAAFRNLFGRGCNAPDQKCDKDRYKRLLFSALLNSGVRPLIGGVEHADDIASQMDLARASADASFGRFVGEWRAALNRFSLQR